MSTRTAQRSCGQLRVTVQGEPVRVSICHCSACQRRTGSVFGTQARFDAEGSKDEGESREFVRISDDGERRSFNFCPECGATVFYRYGSTPHLIAVTVGSFADPAFPAPRISVWEDRRHPWVEVPADMKHAP